MGDQAAKLARQFGERIVFDKFVFAGADGGGTAGGGGGEITLDIEPGRSGQGLEIEILGGELLADAEKGVHGALGVRRDQHQAFARDPRGQAMDTIVSDAGRGEVVQIEVAVVVVGHLAGVVGATTETAQRDDGIGRGAAAGALCQRQVAVEGGEQLLLAGLVDQGHHALLDAVGVQFGVGDAQLGVHQGCTQAVDVEASHGSAPVEGDGAIIHGHIRGPTSQAHG